MLLKYIRYKFSNVRNNRIMFDFIPQVCLCVLVRHIPSLNPAIPQTGFAQPYKGGSFTEDVHTLITSCMQIMGQLPGLCSPKGELP